MSFGQLAISVRLFSTPTELRRLADKMEREFPKRTPGETNHIERLEYVAKNGGPTLIIDLHADQARIERGE